MSTTRDNWYKEKFGYTWDEVRASSRFSDPDWRAKADARQKMGAWVFGYLAKFTILAAIIFTTWGGYV